MRRRSHRSWRRSCSTRTAPNAGRRKVKATSEGRSPACTPERAWTASAPHNCHAEWTAHGESNEPINTMPNTQRVWGPSHIDSSHWVSASLKQKLCGDSSSRARSKVKRRPAILCVAPSWVRLGAVSCAAGCHSTLSLSRGLAAWLSSVLTTSSRAAPPGPEEAAVAAAACSSAVQPH